MTNETTNNTTTQSEAFQEVDLFEDSYGSRQQYGLDTYRVNDPVLRRNLEELDEVFEGLTDKETVYPAEETRYHLVTSQDFTEDQIFVYGMNVDSVKANPDIDEQRFESYRGEYLRPRELRNTLVRLDHEEPSSIPTDVELDNLDFEVPSTTPTISDL